jgi:hypothetical protein
MKLSPANPIGYSLTIPDTINLFTIKFVETYGDAYQRKLFTFFTIHLHQACYRENNNNNNYEQKISQPLKELQTKLIQ